MESIDWDEWRLDGAPPGYSQPYDAGYEGEFEYPIRNDDWAYIELVLPEENKQGLFGNVFVKRLVILFVILLVGYIQDWSFLLGVGSVFWVKYLGVPAFYLYQDNRMDSASGESFDLVPSIATESV